MAERLKAALRRLVGEFRLDYLALYPATVLKDYGDMHLDLRPDRAALPDMVRVPMRLFLPGATVRVSANSRVLLAFEGGDPARPVALLWEAGGLEQVAITASTSVVVEAPTIKLGANASKKVALNGDSVVDPQGGTGSIVSSASKVLAE